MPRIYCKNSTIKEAWVAARGLPGVVDDDEPVVIKRKGLEAFPNLKQQPALLLIPRGQHETPAYWNQQFTWDEMRHLVRFGHRYLSVHFLRQGNLRYDRFSVDLKPRVSQWLNTYREALGAQTADKHALESVEVGYINDFEHDADDFDLSQYFKINFGVDVGSKVIGLSSLGLAIEFLHQRFGTHVTVEATVESAQPKTVTLTTKVIATIPVTNLSFADAANLLDTIENAKTIANDTFFGFATDKTKAIMEAVHEAEA